jgi:integrase/recombinase XerD
VSFFNEDAQKCISDYLEYYINNIIKLKKLFSQKRLEKAFRTAPIRVKDLRKFFSQEWDRRGGPTSVKKILMGHSIRHDVDLMHYNCQSEDDLKKIYDSVMLSSLFSQLP